LSKVTAFTDYVDIQVQVIKDGQVLNNVEAVPRTSALKLSIENRDTKTLSLDVNTTGSTASGYTVASTSSSPTYIKVTGPTSLLESVAALSVNVDVSGAKEDISTSADVKMLDEDGNEIVNDALELSCTKADINVDIARMKTVSITAKTSGTPADGYVITDTILSQASAVITGPDDLLGKVDTITIPSQNINADGLNADKTYTFRLSDYVPSGIKFVSDSSLTVTVKIAQKATMQLRSLNANDNSGVGRSEGNIYALIPLALRQSAASSANSGDILLESNAIATPLSAAPSLIIKLASPCVAFLTV
jgi:YbbR domain-containing protein